VGLFHCDGMRVYKTPEHVRARENARNAALKAAGGPEYEKKLAAWRIARKKYRAEHPRKKRTTFPFKTWLCANARYRGRKLGMEATITPADLDWPRCCPVLGIKLVYPERSGEGKLSGRHNYPSLDRLDNTKGYVPGNVFVISYRANTLKSNATAAELRALADYAERGVWGALCGNGFG